MSEGTNVEQYRGPWPNPNGDPPPPPDTLARTEADEAVRVGEEKVRRAPKRIELAEAERASAEFEMRHARAWLAAAQHTREALDRTEHVWTGHIGFPPGVTVGATVGGDFDTTSPSEHEGTGEESVGIEVPADGTMSGQLIAVPDEDQRLVTDIEEALDALNEVEHAIRGEIAERRASSVFVKLPESDFKITDQDGRPLLLGVTLARANLLAARARFTR